MENVIEINHLKKSFGNNEVLKDISLTVAKGENLVVMGKSGTGKSVLIKCLVRLIDSEEGEIKVLNENILALNKGPLNKLRKKIGFLFQSAALYDSMSVKENLEFPLRGIHHLKQNELDDKVLQALKNVGLEDTLNKMPAELSGGMKKRIGLARTLILNPEIMLYDEPTTGLDPITSKEISELILEMQKKYDTSSIIITHDIECAKITANKVIILDNGVCAVNGTMEELKKSKNKLVKSFLHKS